jgi:hypothetical protein
MPSKLSNGVFHQLSLPEFVSLLHSFTPNRRINGVHLHHTWRPRHADYRGFDTIRGMWRFHTVTQGWLDIAQHLSVAPDGTVWTGRHWDLAPASATGHNGSGVAGPFMIEMIGDFDTGQDPFDGSQKDTTLKVLASLLDRFELAVEAIHFHNAMSGKTCPGTAIPRDVLLGEVQPLRGQNFRAAADDRAGAPFGEDAEAMFQALVFLRGDGADPLARSIARVERWDAEPPESDQPLTALRNAEVALAAASRDEVPAEFTPAIKEALRPYLVNLTRGVLSTSGEFTTSLADVELIFSTHLPNALAAAQAAQQPLRVVVYAHGGLNDEHDGLSVAAKHVHWWVRNGVYPIYFAWETGLISSLMNVIRAQLGVRAIEAQRGDVFDFTDAQIEAVARKFEARRVWSDMKHIAELAAAPTGGSRLVAGRLAAFCNANAGQVEVHAIGHSAGSNFHSQFLPVLLDLGLPEIKTLQFFAPAITISDFLDTLMRRIRHIGQLTMYTMTDSFERADTTAIYQKSLLYLIHEALEGAEETPILGLEKSILDDIRLTRLFGIGGRVTDRTDTVVFSPTSEDDLAAASKSQRHGGFDDDRFTMNSALRRVLGLRGTDPVPDGFVEPTRRRDVEALARGQKADARSQKLEVSISPTVAASSTASGGSSAARGRRRALCVGINAYSRNPLNGCVADARLWARTLEGLGYEPARMLLDHDATRANILSELRTVVHASGPGDVVVFQYSGHGTTVPDRNADEVGGDSPQDDEALCPIDFLDGRLLIDDDLAEIFRNIPPGVRVTSFIDACHSGSVSRLGVGAPGPSAGVVDERPRFVVADDQLIRAHFAFRAAGGGSRAARTSARAAGRDTLFSACRSTEVAWESNGQGDFTRHATPLLAQGIDGVTVGAFLARVISAFGANARQHPEIYPADASLLGLLTAEPLRGSDAPVAAGVLPAAAHGGDVAAVLRAIADLLTAR